MSKENVALVRAIYDAFAKGDVPNVLGAMAPDIVWNEAENYPYADRNPYVGPGAVAEGVFMRIGGEWDGFSVKMDELLDAGDTVVALGRYTGTSKATGKALNQQAAHIWRLKDGKVTRFQQYADTLHVNRVLGKV
jgi:ketosteroid isomerase-like protein